MITYEGEKLICFEAGKLAEIKEVVEWLNKSDWGRRKGFSWQAKLKTWGL